jgi:hypothetical protein
MSDPERLLESSAAHPEVRELLQSLRDVSPAPGESARSWNVIAAKVAALPVLATASKSAAQVGSGAQLGTVVAGASKGLALKVVAGALATALLGAGALVLRAERTEPSPGPKPVPSATPGTPAEPAEAPSIEAASSAATAEKPIAPALPAAGAVRGSSLDLEASMLARVRSELRSGNSRAAEATLNRLQNTLPKAQMGQEREVLAVEVLAANGNMAAARRKAHAFIAAHPGSPHNAKLKRLVGDR